MGRWLMDWALSFESYGWLRKSIDGSLHKKWSVLQIWAGKEVHPRCTMLKPSSHGTSMVEFNSKGGRNTCSLPTVIDGAGDLFSIQNSEGWTRVSHDGWGGQLWPKNWKEIKFMGFFCSNFYPSSWRMGSGKAHRGNQTTNRHLHHQHLSYSILTHNHTWYLYEQNYKCKTPPKGVQPGLAGVTEG